MLQSPRAPWYHAAMTIKLNDKTGRPKHVYWNTSAKGVRRLVYKRPDFSATLAHDDWSDALVPKYLALDEHYERYRGKGKVPRLPEFPPKFVAGLLAKARERAKKKGVPFDLPADSIELMFERQRGRCALSNLQMTLEYAEQGKRPYAPSIDRVDPRKGYVLSNVRLLCSAVNLARLHWSDETFRKICKAVSRNTKRMEVH